MKRSPMCPICGGETERIVYGGQMQDPNGKWVASTSEEWRCVAAWQSYKAAEQVAIRAVREDYEDHIAFIRIVTKVPA